MDSSVLNGTENEADATKPTEELLRPNHFVVKSLAGGDVEGASANASTRSLAGSRTEGVTPGTSVFEGGDTIGEYSQTPLSEVPGTSSGTREQAENVASAKTEEIGMEKSLPVRQFHTSGSPVTTGREYPLSSNDEEKLAGLHVDPTYDHKGKARQRGGAPTKSAGPHSTATGAHPGSTQTSPRTNLSSTVPEGTTTSDIGAGATPSATTKANTTGDKPLAPPKKSRYGFLEKLKIKFEGKDSGRAKGKN
ncbi:hypothetical protein M413DRAFT_448247 [Hebeloma cylindrosporum]|uniref:Uncharacterized protein n=1 Tax=Hebeloma cylindrosporum TaxID=76867 RepID=A0A0C2Y9M9_HEBCY|nr:hypothetical protein M413DRAFT_448247 [Hebeloma cylindrosporum h7]